MLSLTGVFVVFIKSGGPEGPQLNFLHCIYFYKKKKKKKKIKKITNFHFLKIGPPGPPSLTDFLYSYITYSKDYSINEQGHLQGDLVENLKVTLLTINNDIFSFIK